MRKYAYKACLLLIAIMSPVIVCAAGLGRLTVSSAQGQPFRAEIDLVAVKKEEKPSLKARLASQSTFRKANVDYSPLLSTFETSIETHPDGHLYVRIISTEPIPEPLLNMLVELNWSSGRLLREYTVLLPAHQNDGHRQAGGATQAPPVTARAESAARKQETSTRRDGHAPVQDKQASALASGSALGSASESASGPAAGPASASKTYKVYGPVKPGDTLSGIARNIGLPGGVSFNQMLIALQRANRNAFFGNNIHQLKTGPILRIPDNSEIRMISREEAYQEVKGQTANWKRRGSGEIGGAAEELNQMSTGKIDLTAEAAPASAHEPPREVLKLSKGEEAGNAAKNAGSNVEGNVADKGSGKEPNAQHQLHAMQEDATARQGSLQEASERIALLEKNIEKLQRLLELRNSALAGMQKRAEAIQPIKLDEGISTPSPALATRASFFNTKTNTANTGADRPGELTIAPSATDEPVELARPAQAASLPAYQSATNVSPAPLTHVRNAIDDLAANLEYLVGALVLLITGIVGVSMARRPKEAPLPSNDKGNPIIATLGSASRDQVVVAIPGQEMREKTATKERARPAIFSKRASPPADTSPADTSSVSVPVSAEEHALDGINLNMIARFAKPSVNSIKSGFAERGSQRHEIVSGIDLARAYQEMGDKDAATQVLREVMMEGDAQQQESARLILARLRGAVPDTA